jgi:replication factor A1
MAIKDLQARQGNVDIVVEVVDVSQPREFTKFGKTGRVATATVKDETGNLKLSLWNDEIDKVRNGSRIHISNGYVNEYQGELQLTAGRFGKMEVVGDISSDDSEKTTAENKKREALDEESPVSEDEVTEDKVEEEDIDIEEEDVK